MSETEAAGSDKTQQARDAWVEHVLGVKFSKAGGVALPPPPQANAAAVKRMLAALVGRIPAAAGTDTARRAMLLKIANATNDSIKAGNLVAAARAMKDLEAEMDGPVLARTAVTQVWMDAKEALDTRLSALYAKLRGMKIPVLGQVATDMERVFENYRVGLVAALMDYDQAPTSDARRKAAAKALGVIATYKVRLPTDKHVIGADSNPFGLPVAAQQTLTRALDTLSQHLTLA